MITTNIVCFHSAGLAHVVFSAIHNTGYSTHDITCISITLMAYFLKSVS